MRGAGAAAVRIAARRSAAPGQSQDATNVPSGGYVQSAAEATERSPLIGTQSSSYLDHHVLVPEADPSFFSFRKLWAFTGPGFLISIAYLDPGNIEADLEAGSLAQYKLLWVVLWSSVAGLLLQRLAARLGTVTGRHMAEHAHGQYPRPVRILVWLMIELAIIGNDMQEVIGTAIAFYLLSNRIIKVWQGVLITIFDTFTFLLIDKYGMRKLELLFATFIGIMAITFGYEYVVSAPPQGEVIKGVLLPLCEGCGTPELLQVISIIGAIIAPHNLYLHSALVKTRDIDQNRPADVRDANKYYFVETSIAVFVSFIINLFVVSVFGEGLYLRTNQEVRNVCLASGSTYADIFPNNGDIVQADMFQGGIFLGCKFGVAAMYIWAVGLFAAGQSSTMTGCYSGQFVMEGFLHLQWSRWRRVLFTRTLAIVPTLWVAYYSRVEELSIMNDTLNSIMSVQLPFALLPLIAFTSNKHVMGEFVNSVPSTLLALFLSAGIIAANTFYVIQALPGGTLWIALCAVLGIFYVSLVAYLALHMLFSMGLFEGLSRKAFVKKYLFYTPLFMENSQHQPTDSTEGENT
ncbi:natural resistance-associated macrophage protein 1-like [Thrips palmi]|uniref:Natural resistance-associated macrophage protein 1-like n=1 Tax=Thrips palmi TaxID=161013 RepID=A0A6P8Z764_THRPL|nr:natural resistance-associated macrophage protein 1-like [Thrips palmi]